MQHSEIAKLTTNEKDAVLALERAGRYKIGRFWSDNDRAFGHKGTAETARQRLQAIRNRAEENAKKVYNRIGEDAAVALASATAPSNTKYICDECSDGVCWHMATG